MPRIRTPGVGPMPGITREAIEAIERRQTQDVRRAQALEAQRAGQQAPTMEDQAERTLLKFGFTADSFQNFAANIGLGTDNISSGSSYGFNPISRVRTLLEWIHRGTWIGGIAIDVLADDMTRGGVDLQSTLKPEQSEQMQNAIIRKDIWGAINDTIKWARLYGGALGVIMIEGQDPSTPLRIDTVAKDQFLGVWSLDRWMVQPTLSRAGLIGEFGPDFGMPAYYDTLPDQAAIPRMRVHHSRCLRLEGVRLPYWQRVMENLWGISVIERLYDRMVAFDSATQGASQLVYKSFIREYKVEGLRQIVAEGGRKMAGLQNQIQLMRRMQGIEGVSLIDAKDEFNTHGYAGFSGLSDTLMQFGQQISGALQIPLVRLFGQSPAGLNATGESDLITYYDGIKSQQERHLRRCMDKILRIVAKSEGVELPEMFNWKFAPLWQLSDEKKAEVAERITGTVLAAYGQGLISQQIALKELSHQARTTGIFTNISDKDIQAADAEVAPSLEELRQEDQERQDEQMEMAAAGNGEGGEDGPGGGGPPKPPGGGGGNGKANGAGKAYAGPPQPAQDPKALMHGKKGRDATPAARLTKGEAGYVFPAPTHTARRCGGCSMFCLGRDPIGGPELKIGACTLVEGEIEPTATCHHHDPVDLTADTETALGDAKIDNTHTVLTGAISSALVEGLVYVDRSIPETSVLPSGQVCANWRYLAIHELAERRAMERGMNYLDAHEKIATPAELAAVKADGLNPVEYTRHIDGLLAHIEHEDNTNPPADPYVKPAEALSHHRKRAGGAKDALPRGMAAGIPIVIETRAGEARWAGAQAIGADYGYARRVPSAEGPTEWMDVIVGNDPDSEHAWVVDVFHNGGKFDEHKLLLCFSDQQSALEGFYSVYPPDRVTTFGKMTHTTIPALKRWLASADVTVPFAGQQRPRLAAT